MKLYSYWRSGTSYRTRIALNLKGLDYDLCPVDLRIGAHRDRHYLEQNPQGLVPALEVDGKVLTQSPAILEWLEETYPMPALLPTDPSDRAWVRSMATIIGCDTHPLNNLRVLKYLKVMLGQKQQDVAGWTSHWIEESFGPLEKMISEKGGLFAYGNTPTLADCYLVPQVYSAQRFDVPLEAFPNIMRVTRQAMQQPAFIKAHPDNQSDADEM